MKIEILGFAGCPNVDPAIRTVRAALEATGVRAEVIQINVGQEEALSIRFLGSPSVRVNGLDVERAARCADQFGFGCRTYVVNGVRQGVPPQEWIEAGIREALQDGESKISPRLKLAKEV